MKNLNLFTTACILVLVMATGVSFSSENKSESGELNGHEWVDLGLPSGTKWATCNVGASSLGEYGDYFAWGETTPKSEYTIDNSKTFWKSMSDIAGNPSYDAATANWGKGWRMPTKAQIEELLNGSYCIWTWTTKGGYVVTSKKNGNRIFLPAAGIRDGSSLDYAGVYGCYWSSTPYEDNTRGAYYLTFASEGHDWDWANRFYGFPVRAVTE